MCSPKGISLTHWRLTKFWPLKTLLPPDNGSQSSSTWPWGGDPNCNRGYLSRSHLCLPRFWSKEIETKVQYKKKQHLLPHPTFVTATTYTGPMCFLSLSTHSLPWSLAGYRIPGTVQTVLAACFYLTSGDWTPSLTDARWATPGPHPHPDTLNLVFSLPFFDFHSPRVPSVGGKRNQPSSPFVQL